jgi:16S rRNA (cytidine1402-2'-O)-methyltransferase
MGAGHHLVGQIMTYCHDGRPAGSPVGRSARNVVPGMNSSDSSVSTGGGPAGGVPAGGVPAGGGPASDVGTLTVAAVPIGRPGDASPLLAHALATAPVIAAEDTRRLRKLAAALGVEPAGKIISFYEAVERAREPRLIETLLGGQDVLLVTDAGMPVISDPGYRLVAAAAAAAAHITVLPGPSAVIAALAVSGLPTDRFCFEGFPPRKPGERARRLAELATEPRTMVFFESPRRLASTLADLEKAFGPDRRAVVCRELTKTHEEVRRGTLAELAGWAADGVLGEITLVVEGATGTGPTGSAPSRTPAQAAAEVEHRIAAGQPRNAAIAAVAHESGLRRAEVYDAVAAARRAPGAGPDSR